MKKTLFALIAFALTTTSMAYAFQGTSDATPDMIPQNTMEANGYGHGHDHNGGYGHHGNCSW